jgi:membrane protease subunit HflK
MPWNDNGNPGPWGAPPPSGGKGPSGDEPKRPAGPGPRRPSGQPDLDQFQQRLKDALRDLLGGSGGGGAGGDLNPRRVAPLFAGGLAALYLLSGIIVVGAKEEAVVTTFGAWTRSYVPGIGYHLPLFESVAKVDITTLRKTEIGGDTGSGDTLMLTGDENIVDLSFSVTWRVSNPGWYLFNIDKQEDTVKAVAESAMREVIGRSALDPIISRGRGQIQIEVAELMQRILDSYNAGIIIDGVQYDAGPPKEVVDAFRDVNNASQNAESRANQARGTAAEVVQQAKGYQSQVVREAAGDAARFNQVYEQYRLAPGVTRDRLYIETMERVLSRTNKVIIDSKGASAPIILPPEVFRPRALPSPTLAPAPVQGAAQ